MQPSENHAIGPVAAGLPAVLTTVSEQVAPPASPALTWRAAAMQRDKGLPAQPQASRCSERGCVFPASGGADGKCLHHLRQNQEPILFSSYQPTRAVLDRGRFGSSAVAEEVDTSRSRDKRQLVAMREAFLEG